jgi:ABC-type bacteriocin/lantibiotic exporter with double-glycine peptidase domain
MVRGEIGAGKSTFMRMIAGLYTPQSGSISYNGLPAANIELGNLRSRIGDGLSIEQIFNGTLLENITLDRSHADLEMVKSLAVETGLAEFVRSLPKGYDTMLDPQGQKLPSGIAARIILLRSLAGNPGLLLLESLFEQWTGTEKERIINMLFTGRFRQTMIILSDDPAIAGKVDRVLVFDKGTLVSDIRQKN